MKNVYYIVYGQLNKRFPTCIGMCAQTIQYTFINVPRYMTIHLQPLYKYMYMKQYRGDIDTASIYYVPSYNLQLSLVWTILSSCILLASIISPFIPPPQHE